MTNEQEPKAPAQLTRLKPYCVVGAGCLTSHIWKQGDGDEQFSYRFNLFRTQRNGRVTQLLRPDDVLPLAKFVCVISQVLVDDGCISQEHRRIMRHLASALDDLLDSEELRHSEENEKPNSEHRRKADGDSTSA